MNTLLFTLLLGLALGHLVFLINRTDFIAEYSKKFFGEEKLMIRQYEDWKVANNIEIGYPIFIRETFPTFYGRLFGCPFCLVTFCSMILSPLSLSFYFILCGFAAAGIGSILYLIENLLYKKNFS